MHEVDFELILDNVPYMTDEQLGALSFAIWACQSDRYQADAIASAGQDDVELSHYSQIRG